MNKAAFANRQEQLLTQLREARLAAGLRQTELAERLGTPQSFVSKYESGERRLDLLELQQICQALNLSLTNFVRAFEEASQ
ncbi:MAG: helix-turn-helix transcriptional regulator [Acidobacteria bacterium]|nr:helix-turn-helix transcriptional regulator [Acidobacteriota bacterium]